MIKIGNLDINKIYLGGTEVSKAYLGDVQVYGGQQPVYQHDYLTFTALEPTTVDLRQSYKTEAENDKPTYYSTDKHNWTYMGKVGDTAFEPISMNTGDKIYLKGKVLSNDSYGSNKRTFDIRGNIKLTGSLMSLHNENPDDTELTYSGEFLYLFANLGSHSNYKLDISEFELPEVECIGNDFSGFFGLDSEVDGTDTFEMRTPTIGNAEHVFERLFLGCYLPDGMPNLLNRFNIPRLGKYAYSYAFSNVDFGEDYRVVNLDRISWNPNDDSNVEGCFSHMFDGSNVTKARNMIGTFTTWMHAREFEYMFANCADLTSATGHGYGDLNNTSTEGVFSHTFYNCPNLTESDVLDVVAGYYWHFESNACESMYEGCTSLKSIGNHTTAFRLGVSINADEVFKNMFKNSGIEYASNILINTNGIYQNNDSLCESMFEGCSNLYSPALTYIKRVIGENTFKNMYKDSGYDGRANDYIFSEIENISETLNSNGNFCGLFRNCTNLNQMDIFFANMYSADNLARYFNSFMDGVSSTGNFNTNEEYVSAWQSSGLVPEDWTYNVAQE